MADDTVYGTLQAGSRAKGEGEGGGHGRRRSVMLESACSVLKAVADSELRSELLCEGARVEVQPPLHGAAASGEAGGGARPGRVGFRSGTIKTDHGDGTFDIAYFAMPSALDRAPGGGGGGGGEVRRSGAARGAIGRDDGGGGWRVVRIWRSPPPSPPHRRLRRDRRATTTMTTRPHVMPWRDTREVERRVGAERLQPLSMRDHRMSHQNVERIHTFLDTPYRAIGQALDDVRARLQVRRSRTRLLPSGGVGGSVCDRPPPPRSTIKDTRRRTRP